MPYCMHLSDADMVELLGTASARAGTGWTNARAVLRQIEARQGPAGEARAPVLAVARRLRRLSELGYAEARREKGDSATFYRPLQHATYTPDRGGPGEASVAYA